MPSPFDITAVTNTVVLDNQRQGVAIFTVHNNTRRRIQAAAQVTTQPPDAVKWLTILPPDGVSATADLRDFPIDATQQYQIKIAVPMDAAPASYTLRLTVADNANPDDNFSVSPDMQFTVRAVPVPAPKPFPTWIVPAVLIGVVVIVAIILGGVALSNRTPPPTPTMGGPCQITMKAAQFVYQQPDTIANTMFDQVQSGRQLTPVGRSADNAWWKTTYFDTWIQTSLLNDTAVISGDCTHLPALCLLTIKGDVDMYSQPVNNTNTQFGQAHAGWQLTPVGKLADGTWWKIGVQNSWIPTSAFGSLAQTSGDCNSLPVVTA